MKMTRYVSHENIVGDNAASKTNVEIKWLSRFAEKHHRDCYASILRMRNFTHRQVFERTQFLKKHDVVLCNRCLIMWDEHWQTSCPNCGRMATGLDWFDVVYPGDFSEEK